MVAEGGSAQCSNIFVYAWYGPWLDIDAVEPMDGCNSSDTAIPKPTLQSFDRSRCRQFQVWVAETNGIENS